VYQQFEENNYIDFGIFEAGSYVGDGSDDITLLLGS